MASPAATQATGSGSSGGRRMELGALVPHIGPLADPELVLAFCRAADAAGFDGLWTADHLVVPKISADDHDWGGDTGLSPFDQMRQTMGLNLVLDATLAAAAAVTSSARLHTGVAVPALRNPLANAHQLATIDLLSGGRVTYGVGIGWLREEADALGMPWDRRGARTDEIIALLRTLWAATGPTVEFHGRFYDVPEIDVNPRPIQRPIPIYVGGLSDAAIDRVARLGDGWIAMALGRTRLAERLERLDRACEAHGRDPSSLAVVDGERPEVALDTADRDTAGQVERTLEHLAAYEASGVTHMKVSLQAESASGLLELVDLAASELIPAWRRR